MIIQVNASNTGILDYWQQRFFYKSVRALFEKMPWSLTRWLYTNKSKYFAIVVPGTQAKINR